MSRSNTLGAGLQTEMSAVRRVHMATVQKAKLAVVPTPAPVVAPAAQRRVLAFKPTLPAVSKKVHKEPLPKGSKTRLVFKVNVKSPALKRRLGVA